MKKLCPWRHRCIELLLNLEGKTLIGHGIRTVLYFDLKLGGVINHGVSFPKSSHTLDLEFVCVYGTHLSIDYFHMRFVHLFGAVFDLFLLYT